MGVNWNKADKDLQQIEDLFKICNEKNEYTITINDHDWPERSLKWFYNSCNRRLQFFLNDDMRTYCIAGGIWTELFGYKSKVEKFQYGIDAPFDKINIKIIYDYISIINNLNI